jgi:hypothetical protein
MKDVTIFGWKFMLVLIVMGFVIANIAPAVTQGLNSSVKNVMNQSEVLNGITDTIKNPNAKNAEDLAEVIYGNNNPIKNGR